MAVFHNDSFDTGLRLTGSSVPGILQTSILEWAAVPSSRGSSRPRGRTHASYISCIGRWVLYHQNHLGSPEASRMGSEYSRGLPSWDGLLPFYAQKRPSIGHESWAWELDGHRASTRERSSHTYFPRVLCDPGCPPEEIKTQRSGETQTLFCWVERRGAIVEKEPHMWGGDGR